MHLFGFTKKTKKRLSSGQLRLGLRKVKSTGNIASGDSDSSTDSDNSDAENYSSSQDTKSKPLVTSVHNELAQTLKPSVEKTGKDDTLQHQQHQQKEKKEHGLDKDKTLSNRWNKDVDPNDLDALLSMETQLRLDAQTERDKLESALPTPPRPTRLKFELPETPSRSRSPKPIAYPRARPYRSLSEERVVSVNRKKSDDSNPRKQRHTRWSKLMGSDSDDDTCAAIDKTRHLEVGTYVRLLKRPLPTMGYVRYIGPVEGEPGDWIGVELQHRVGNCDGLIKGQRFFKTDPQRGIFLKRFDVEAVI